MSGRHREVRHREGQGRSRPAAAAGGAGARTQTRLGRTRLRRRRHRAGLVAAGVGSLVLVLGTTGLVVFRGGPVQGVQRPAHPARGIDAASASPAGPAAFSDPQAARDAVAAAGAAVESANSYDYRRMHSAVSAALAVSTDAYGATLRESLTGALAAAASARHTVQHCQVDAVAVRGLDAAQGRAELIVLASLNITDIDSPAGAHTSLLSLGVSMSRENGNWLLAGMQPLQGASLPPAAEPGGPGLAAAVQVAARGITDLLSFRRADFGADFARALTDLTDELAAQQQANRAEILDAMARGGFDLSAQLLAAAPEAADGDTASVLVVVQSYRDPDSGPPVSTGQSRYRVQVLRTGQRWLVAGIVSVDGR